ncbi:MAG: hypothetical protein WKG00_23220 [Polyangiaceae bacterium]
MPRRHRSLGIPLLLAIGVLGLAGGPSQAQSRRPADQAEAKAVKQACIDAHGAGQSLQREGKLAAARERFVGCGREECPSPIRRDCAQWLATATESQPSVVVEARDEMGQPTTDVRVFVDGVQMAAALDGRALEVDPGSRAFRYVSGRGTVLEERLVVLEGQKNRKLLAVFPRDAVPPPPYRVPTMTWVLGGVGLGALANFVLWGVIGRVDEDNLDRCAPRCPQEDADTLHREYVLADISLLLALGSFGGATAFALTARSAPAKDAPQAAIYAGPGWFGVRGTF